MKITILKISVFVLLLSLMGAGCKKDEDKNLKELDGYIVGFNPCSVHYHYRIGYVIISTDLKDTLATYNLSDETFKMPASVLFHPSDTLYKIPESYFKNGWGGMYFQASSRYEFKVKGTYRYAKENEKSTQVCTNDLDPNLEQIIIISATK
ncbi:MAG TPA: hypothetical protein DCR40_04525 [Prolixibacteraceae bacterium]|nr:hypothetical protein [Prolixibacteraceae bacterium]